MEICRVPDLKGQERYNMIKKLQVTDVVKRCDETKLGFSSTEELPDLEISIGQQRAREAIELAVHIQQKGYNIFALGPPGVGKRQIVNELLSKEAIKQKIPSDWCYINNFADPQKPQAVSLSAGKASVLNQDLEQLIRNLRERIPSLFESEDYLVKRKKLDQELKDWQEKELLDIQSDATKDDLIFIQTIEGFLFVPTKKGKELSTDDINALTVDERAKTNQKLETYRQRFADFMQKVIIKEKDLRMKIRNLHQEMIVFAVGHLIDEIKQKYTETPTIVNFLNSIQKDIIENAEDIRRLSRVEESKMLQYLELTFGEDIFRKYRVNVFVNNEKTKGAPIVFADHPTYPNLIGRIDHVSKMGTLISDFTLIKAGALHQANGGYLIFDVEKVLTNPFSWNALKRSLRTGKIEIEPPGESIGLFSTSVIQPEPIPFDCKVILIGSRILYYLLSEYDAEFSELFKIAADFEEDIERKTDSEELLCQLIATHVRKLKLNHFDKSGVARLIEQSSRIEQDRQKLSIHLQKITDIMCEANQIAIRQNDKLVKASHVQAALDHQIYRTDRIRSKIYETITRKLISIATDGDSVGQVNGLSVLQMADLRISHPTRISASVSLGQGEVVDIEREAELGGPIHTKGMMILSGFLRSQYALGIPLSIAARVVFEQSYSGVEGDSASLAELIALLSAITDTPIKQSWAVTGSINQYGDVQAIGAVNEKIEGFFDLCLSRGLTGDQGVIIPQTNTQHLMLKAEVVQAISENKFHIHAVDKVNDCIEILSGMPAGEINSEGQYPENSFNYLVTENLLSFAQTWALWAREFASPVSTSKTIDQSPASEKHSVFRRFGPKLYRRP